MRVLEIKNPFNAPVYHEKYVDSTMITARNLALKNEPHGTVICADFQSAGRGRQGRNWHIESKGNLMFTILLRYRKTEALPKALTLRTGLAVSLALEEFSPELQGLVKVKWPNDIIIRDKKITGILAETDGNNVFIGIGVNITQREFPEELREKASSLINFIPLPGENPHYKLLEFVLSELFHEFEEDSGKNSWHEKLTKKLYKMGETVVFSIGAAGSEKLIKGTLKGINKNGELCIVPEGRETIEEFPAGELKVY